MQDKSLVSVIIPVFNVESYLPQCIDSVLNQSYSYIEVILIDDGSTDGSGKICDDFTEKDARVKCIHKQNEGVSKARQIGFSYSSGEWILFVDSDDEIPINAISKLTACLQDNPHADLVIGGFQYIPKSKFQIYYKDESLLKNDLLIKYLKGKIHTGPVAKLMKKSIIHLEDFDMPSSIKMGEDAIMNVRIASRIQKAIVLHDIVYSYFIRSSSVCQTFRWTFRYVREFESIFFNSFEENFIKKKFIIVFLNKAKRRYSIVKSFIKVLFHKDGFRW